MVFDRNLDLFSDLEAGLLQPLADQSYFWYCFLIAAAEGVVNFQISVSYEK